MSTRPVAGGRTLLQTAALIFGVVFVLVAILGFIPGITEHAPGMVAGHDSDALLLGIFQVSILHNIVHLLFGVAGIAMSRTNARAKTYLVYGGAIYIVLFVLGLVMAGKDTAINFVPVNLADNFLHLGLGIVMIGAGLVLGRDTASAST